MWEMDYLHLLDFIELRLKSKEYFNTAYGVVISTAMTAHRKKFMFLSQVIGLANFIANKTCMNPSKSY